MKSLANTIVTVVITFLITLALNFAIGLLTEDNGAVKIGPSSVVNGQMYMPVDVTNSSEATIDDLVLFVPQPVEISAISVSSPVQLVELPDVTGVTDKKRISISGLEHNRLTRLLIPVTNQDEAQLIRVANGPEKKIASEPIEAIPGPARKLLTNAAVTAMISSLLYGVYMFWHWSQLKLQDEQREHVAQDLRKRFNETETRFLTEQEMLHKRIARTEDELRENVARFHRARILLLARLSDYAKELDFWRDTVRKVFYQSSRNEREAEMLIEQVTSTLKTYSTRKEADTNFETLKVLAGLLNASTDNRSEHEGEV